MNKITQWIFENKTFLLKLSLWPRGVMVIATAQLHSIKSELRLWASSNPAHGVWDSRNGTGK